MIYDGEADAHFLAPPKVCQRFDHDAHELALFRDNPSAFWLHPRRWELPLVRGKPALIWMHDLGPVDAIENVGEMAGPSGFWTLMAGTIIQHTPLKVITTTDGTEHFVRH